MRQKRTLTLTQRGDTYTVKSAKNTTDFNIGKRLKKSEIDYLLQSEKNFEVNIVAR